MVFRPSLDVGVPDGFYDLIDGLVGDVYKQASKISRLAAHSGQEHYQVQLGAGSLVEHGDIVFSALDFGKILKTFGNIKCELR